MIDKEIQHASARSLFNSYQSIFHVHYMTIDWIGYGIHFTWYAVNLCVCSEISRTYWRKNVINREFSRRCWKYNEISPIVQANYRSKRIDFSLEILRDFSMKIRKDKERNSRISLALPLHSTV